MTGTTKGTFKTALSGARPQIGVRTQIANAMVAEALGCCGFDYVYIDMEHSPADALSVMHQCQAVQATPAHAVVRLPGSDPILIQKLLDLGVENFVVPMVDTAEQARAVVASTRYPPQGIRSFARVHRGNRYGGDASYAQTAAERICVIVQAETRAALANIREIAVVPGLDGVLFGPADLAADMGHIGNPDGPEVSAAIRTAVDVIVAAGGCAGMSTGSAAKGREWIAAGCRFVSVAGDLALLVGQARRIAFEAAGS